MSYQFISGLGGYGLRAFGDDTDCPDGMMYMMTFDKCVPICGVGYTRDNTTGDCIKRDVSSGSGCPSGLHWITNDSEGTPVNACVMECLPPGRFIAGRGCVLPSGQPGPINQTGKQAGCPTGTIQRWDGSRWVCGQPCPAGTSYFFDGSGLGVCRRPVAPRPAPTPGPAPDVPSSQPPQQMGLLPLGIAAVVGVGLLVLIAHAQQSRQAA